MKKLFAYSLLLVIVVPILMWFFGKPANEKAKDNLPWQIEQVEDGSTRVFGLDVGRLTLQELMMDLHKIAELSVFEDENKHLVLEGYFGKVTLGVFEAKLIAEMDATQEQLRPMIVLNEEREGTPSGRWKYDVLDPEHVRQTNQMRVWKLVYVPVANYEPAVIEKYFGKPASKESVSDEFHYWYYPDKNFVILESAKGKETFYYVAKQDYQRLLKDLPKTLAEDR